MQCSICGGEAALVREPSTYTMELRTVTIDDEFIRCSRCGESYYPGEIADEPFRRVTAKIRAEDGLLTSDEIVALRERYGLSQAGLERLIGAGEKTVVRWERGTVCQNRTADTLLRVLAAHPAVVAELARERGVKLKSPRRAAASRVRAPRASRASAASAERADAV